jgi:hypothetical protein
MIDSALAAPYATFFPPEKCLPVRERGHLALKKIASVACRPVIFVRQLLTNCLPRSN